MYKPDNASKKALKMYDTCAYVYNDGVAILEKRRCKSGKESFIKAFEHAQACEIDIRIVNPYTPGNYGEKFIGRFVFHNPTLLLDGIERIEIYYHNSSENMRKDGVDCTTVTLITTSGMKIREDDFTYHCVEMVIQNDRPNSLLKQVDYQTIWHGPKPELKEESDAA